MRAGGAAAALANLRVNPGGDWTTQAGNPYVLIDAIGAEILKQKADEGDRAAQFSLGVKLMSEEAEGGAVTLRDAAGKAEVGLALCTDTTRHAHHTEMRRWSPYD